MEELFFAAFLWGGGVKSCPHARTKICVRIIQVGSKYCKLHHKINEVSTDYYVTYRCQNRFSKSAINVLHSCIMKKAESKIRFQDAGIPDEAPVPGGGSLPEHRDDRKGMGPINTLK